MMSDREAPCPQCGEEIHVIKTLDADRCPECGTDRDTLFDIAMSKPIEPAESKADVDLQAALTDGGVEHE